MIGMLLALLSLNANAQLLKKDPYKENIPAFTHVLKARVLYHGTKKRKDWLNEQIKSTQLIYAQCGMGLRIDVTSTQELPLSTGQDNLTEVRGNQIFVSQSGIDFLSKFLPGKMADVVDIHVVDHLEPRIRAAGTTRAGSRFLGVAYNPMTLGWIYHDARVNPPYSHVSIYGNSLFLAAQTVKMMDDKNENFVIIRARNVKMIERKNSLMAHELGHILLEGQTPETHKFYTDHYCVGVKDYCGKDNLMSGGGYPDRKHEEAESGKFLGYDPLPQVDEAQCEVLLRHPLIKAL